MVDNTYLLGDYLNDQQRLTTQTELFSDYLRSHAPRLIGHKISSILDLGCGDGRLGLVLHEVNPHARLVGIDRDPNAIEVARQRVADRGLTDIEYVVGDVEQALPPGPFDLIYASAIMLHVRNLVGVLRSCYAALQPGGYLWVKDTHPQVTNFTDMDVIRNMGRNITTAMKAIGSHYPVISELLTLLPEIGFVDVQQVDDEVYPYGGTSEPGRATMALAVGGYYNAKPLLVRVLGLAEAEIDAQCVAVLNAGATGEIGSLPWANLIARRPADNHETHTGR